MRFLAGAALALVLAAMPLAAQPTDTPAGTVPAGASGAQASPNESELIIPDSGDASSRTAVPGRNAPGAPAGQGAQAGQPTQGVQISTPGVSTWDFVRMLIILAAVVGAIYLLFWILRRSTGRKITENDLIRVLGSRSLAGNKSLHLVEVGSSVFLVGASDGGVELISEIKDKESLDSVRLKAAEESPAGRRSFQELLSEIFRPAARPISLGDGVGFLRGQRDKLKKL